MFQEYNKSMKLLQMVYQSIERIPTGTAHLKEI